MPSLSAETAQQMAEEYDFTEEKLGYVAELLSEEYAELWGEMFLHRGTLSFSTMTTT